MVFHNGHVGSSGGVAELPFVVEDPLARDESCGSRNCVVASGTSVDSEKESSRCHVKGLGHEEPVLQERHLPFLRLLDLRHAARASSTVQHNGDSNGARTKTRASNRKKIATCRQRRDRQQNIEEKEEQKDEKMAEMDKKDASLRAQLAALQGQLRPQVLTYLLVNQHVKTRRLRAAADKMSYLAQSDNHWATKAIIKQWMGNEHSYAYQTGTLKLT
ncbi:hypothetical protein PM082_018423 [Marasmius tenuissimus]|nr:hypothetical protein PM082_018423 [Marasmius tenuissimus]